MSRTILILSLFMTLSFFASAQSEPRVITSYELDSIINVTHDTTYVMNFWATWCKPCIKEIPYFERVGVTYGDRNLKIYLIRLDFSEQLEGKLKPYMVQNSMKQEVLLMDDTDYDKWISKVDENWQGAIPATLIFNNHSESKYFIQKEFNEPELESLIKSYIQ